MALNVNITVDMRDTERVLRQLGTLNDLEAPLRRSAVVLERNVGMRFRNANWRPLARATMDIHPHRAGGKPLNDTGLLKRSITSQAVKTISGNKLTYGTSDKRAPIHNFGGRTSWGTIIPQRKFLYIDNTDEQMIVRVFVDYIRGLIR